jgi:phosphopantothenoylcysteine synthetase/decarboxylase
MLSHCWEKIIKNPHHINIVREKKAIRIMRKRYLRLKYKLKNNPKMLADIAKDWQDYVHAIHEFISEKEVFEMDFGDHGGESDAVWRFKKRVSSQIIRKDQIEGRFCKLLGISEMSMQHMKLDTDIYKRK